MTGPTCLRCGRVYDSCTCAFFHHPFPVSDQPSSVMASELPDENSCKPWAVVQDLSPFGIRVECRHRYRWLARRCVGRSNLLMVMPYDVAIARDAALAAQLRSAR